MLAHSLRVAFIAAFTFTALLGCSTPIHPMTEACDGPCPCTSDTSCLGNTPRCDRNTGKCVPCLPLNDNCPKGERCLPSKGSFTCASGCLTDVDCPKADGGGALTCCNGACLGTTSDIANCGGCGKACPTLANATSACTLGMCVLGTCDTGYADCDNNKGNGCESDTTSDDKNCGGCGKPCVGGANGVTSCAGGMCRTTCSQGFEDCDRNAANGCEINTASDLNNCGGCGKACGALPNAQVACLSGACAIASCNNGFADCDHKVQTGCEVALSNDTGNCGACGQVCNYPNAVAVCKGGGCSIGTCNMGFADCDFVAANGCEVPTGSDPKNCGTCAHVCGGAHSVQGCNGGACGIMACDQGYSDCDMNPVDGCEVNIGMDLNNCGGCGKVCPTVQNGTATCANAMCGVGGCKFGFAHCSNNPMDGCEVNVASDLNNCGQCAKVCPQISNGTPACKGGACGIGSCNNLYGDCDLNAANGCEKSLATDLNNCGACGKTCSFANASGSCLNGQCGISQCNQGFADCDGNPQNGCETNIGTDAKNCGKCAMVCPVNAPTCTNGGCVGFVCNPSCINGGVCIGNNQCGTPNHAPGTFGPIHTFAGLMSDFFISTGQGGCSVNSAQNAAVDAQYFCNHFYGLNCSVNNGYSVTTRSGNKMHKNSGCTSLGTDIPNTVCDLPAAPGMACKMWNSTEVDSGLINLVCVCQ